jgi:hypothetical protein
MFRALTALFAIAAVGLGFYAWQLRGDLNDLRGKITSLENERDAAQKAGQAAAKAQKTAEEETASYKERNAGLKTELETARKSGPAVAAKAPEAGQAGEQTSSFKQMADMFKTEEGKNMMKAQLAMATKMQYGDLARVLKLTPQEAEQVMALLNDRTAAVAGDPSKFWGGNLDAASVKKIGEDSAAARKEYDAKLKAVLGEQKFQELQAYDQTIGDRMMMAQMDPQFTAAGAPLQQEQRDQIAPTHGRRTEEIRRVGLRHDRPRYGRQLRMLSDDAAGRTLGAAGAGLPAPRPASRPKSPQPRPGQRAR